MAWLTAGGEFGLLRKAISEWLTHHALYTSAEFPVRAFSLYSSKLTSDGSIYRIEQHYPLEVLSGEADD